MIPEKIEEEQATSGSPLAKRTGEYDPSVDLPPIQSEPISAILPIFNDLAVLQPALEAWISVLNSLNRDYEVLLVDDASADGTLNLAQSLVEKNPKVCLLHHEAHTGFGACLRTGLAAARFPLLLISTYIVSAQLDIIDTYMIVILVNCVFTLPVCIWTLKSFFDSLPIEVEEAAMIDGAGPFRTLLRIVAPMARPGLTAAAIYAFVTAWNDLTIGLTLTTSTDMRPLPAGISVTFLQEFQYQWPEMMAVATVATLPILALFVAFQHNFIEGVTAGAIKQ